VAVVTQCLVMKMTLLSQESEGGSMGRNSHPIVELDASGSVECTQEMEAAKLPVLHPACVTVLHDGCETE
jgi:hypothetical protein